MLGGLSAPGGRGAARAAGASKVVIVTGAAGYIGSHVCEALLRRGDAVVAVDAFTHHYDPAFKRANLASVEATARRSQATSAATEALSAPESSRRVGAVGAGDTTAAVWRHGNFQFLERDVRRAGDLNDVFAAAAHLAGSETAVRHVIHLAARAGVRAPLSESPDYVSANLVATTEVLEACRRHGLGQPTADDPPSPGQGDAAAAGGRAGHLVMASSSSVYGAGPPGWEGPFAEDFAADRPLSIYAATKRGCELLAHAYTRLAGFHTTCLRFFTVMGPRARPDLTPFTFTDAIWHGKPIMKFGDGDSARDYTFVGDIVIGVLAALDRFERAAAGLVEPGEPHECINLGGDHPVTLNQYLDTLERLLDKPAIIRQMPEQPMDPKRTWADQRKARRLLGYRPETPFEQALEECVSWFLEKVAQVEPADTAAHASQ